MPLAELPLSTRKLISSSQVISSVSSVVKELMENALDAEASNIEVKLENNGLNRIEVKDDGCGINRTDVECICLPHYTSKISTFSDLSNLRSYGFRGEALSSLCNVADITITTRTTADDHAVTFFFNKDGTITKTKPSHFGKGTQVVVTSLFRNLPVRKQYLSSSRRAVTELKRVEAVTKSLALINPTLRVSFCHNKCMVWQKASAPTLRESVMLGMGHGMASRLEHLSSTHKQLSITLVVPKKFCKDVVTLCQTSVDCMMIYFNRRPVRYKKLEKLVVKHIQQHFTSQFLTGKYPTCVVSLELEPSELDVNLEPNKTRVLCHNEEDILSKVDKLLCSYYEPKVDAEPAEPVNVVKRPRLEPVLDSSANIKDCDPVNATKDVQSECIGRTSTQVAGDIVEQLLDVSESLPSTNLMDITGDLFEQTMLEVGQANLEKQAEPDPPQLQADCAASQNLWDAADRAMGLWSRGCVKTERGDLIQANTLLVPTAVAAPQNEDMQVTLPPVEEAEPELPAPRLEKPNTFNAATKEKRANSANSVPKDFLNASYGSVSSQMGCKEQSAFTKFSREMRPKLLLENPGLPFTRVANMLVNEWRNLPAEERDRYENIAKEERKKPHDSSVGCRKLVDMFASPHQTTKEKSTHPSEEMNVSLDDIKTKRRNAAEQSQKVNLDFLLLGQLKPCGTWLYRKGRDLGVVRHWALHEVVIYRRLLAEHTVPVVPLETPENINESTLGSDMWKLLMSMEMTHNITNTATISSPEIVKNGFQIDVKPDGVVLLTHVASTIRFYGLDDLRELLRLVQLFQHDLSCCRPFKVLNYIKSEAVRIARQAVAAMNYQQVLELLQLWNVQDEKCLHRKPIFEVLHHLDSDSETKMDTLKKT